MTQDPFTARRSPPDPVTTAAQGDAAPSLLTSSPIQLNSRRRVPETTGSGGGGGAGR
jgi:hypothetical protein